MAQSHDPTQPRETGVAGPATGGVSRRRFCRGALVVALGAGVGLGAVAGCSDGDEPEGARSSDADAAGDGGDRPVMYSSPTCGCCGLYADYLRANGHDVDVRHRDDLASVREEAGIPDEAQGCHTTLIGGYAVEGHVPVEAIDKLLSERPDLDGIALPGMPAGSPGMGDDEDATFDVVGIKDGTVQPYVTV